MSSEKSSTVATAASDSSSRTPSRKRSSKACETCRVRRIKCHGPPPCEPCRAAGLSNACTVRFKARPKRAPSAKLQSLRERAAIGAITSPETFIGAPLSSVAGPADRRNPLDEIEDALAVWCLDRQVNLAQLVFKVDTRLATTIPTPLPDTAVIVEYEDMLMEQLFASPEVVDRAGDNRTLLRSLYGRYRALPQSLTDDQRALIYAMLCISRYTQVTLELGSGATHVARDDITYFNMALSALTDWNRASLFAVWSLIYILPFTIEMGGLSETRDVLQQVAGQITELGLHKHSTAALYQPHEQVGTVFSAFFYLDMLRASLVDLRPTLPLTEIDIDPSSAHSTLPEFLRRAFYFTTKVLGDHADPTMDTTSLSYITATEAQWAPYLRDLRHSKIDAPRAKICWAEFRYNWLRILLYAPHLSTALAPQAYAMIARSVAQIMHIYVDLIAANTMKPSWPQLHRITICGQLLILCHEAGEFHQREAQTLFQILVDVLQKHQDQWAVAYGLVVGFKAAAAIFDIHVDPEPSIPLYDQLSLTSEDLAFPFFPFDLGLDLDMSSLPF